MATPVLMPRLGNTVESCVLTQWCKQVGEQVNVGDILFVYETDKSTFEEEAQASGKMVAHFYDEGDDIPCLNVVCVIGEEGEKIDEFRPGGQAEVKADAMADRSEKPAGAMQEENTPQLFDVKENNILDAYAKVSPRARMAAARAGVDWRNVAPSGPGGRIIERDVLAAAEAGQGGAGLPQRSRGARFRESMAMAEQRAPQAAPPCAGMSFGGAETTDVPLSGVRKVIARAMHDSLANSAQLTLHSAFDASAIQALRAQIKAGDIKGLPTSVTLGDMVMFAAARVLTQHEDINAHFLGDAIRHFSRVHLGMAVDTPRGLLVPTIRDADTLSLGALSGEAKRVATLAQNGNISPDLMQGASFTVTNLGAMGVEMFTPIINPPQAAILGVCAPVPRVRADGSGIAVYPSMGLSLTFDHRAVDGAPAARFLQAVCKALENIQDML